jgi:MFS family permease
MRSWVLRGLVFAAAMVVVRLFQGALINAWQTQAGLISIVLLVLFVIGVFVWGLFDGRADARANPDPDRRADLAMTWLLAGLLAGILSGAVAWLIALVYKGLYTGGLINEVTTFAAFTALLVFLPGIIGVAVGRWRVDRNPPPRPHGAPGEERADSDVFSAVRGDDSPTGEIPAQTAAGPRAEERTGSVATAEREADTESIPTARREETTETIPTSGDDAKTDAIRTDVDAKHAKPGEEPEKG